MDGWTENLISILSRSPERVSYQPNSALPHASIRHLKIYLILGIPPVQTEYGKNLQDVPSGGQSHVISHFS